MGALHFVFIFVIAFVYCTPYIGAFPANNPNAEYELITGGAQIGPKPNFVPITHKPLVINTPPPAPVNTKNFAYDPLTKSWTLVKKGDPIPSEGTLLWNQSNDKWLTETARHI